MCRSSEAAQRTSTFSLSYLNSLSNMKYTTHIRHLIDKQNILPKIMHTTEPCSMYYVSELKHHTDQLVATTIITVCGTLNTSV